MKKCPPGVFCIENMTLILFIIIIGLIVFIFYSNMKQVLAPANKQSITIEQKSFSSSLPSVSNLFGLIPSYPYNNLPKDVLLDPYAAPYSDERYFIPELNYVRPGAVPINVSTSIGAVDTNYRQMGIITPLNGSSTNNILSLMGRPLFTNRQKFQYYTISNQHNNVKLPISFKGKSALSDYGVDQIYNGDTVYVEGYNEPFKVTVYENDTIKYLPFL